MQFDLKKIEPYLAITKHPDITANILQKMASVVDLTSLNDTDDDQAIDALCQKAIFKWGHVAAVCVYPRFINRVAPLFLGKPVKIATVANFPDGNDLLDNVEQSIQTSLQSGAHEIDVVFPYSRFLSGDKKGAFDFIHACKNKVGNQGLLKVILETGALKELFVIAEISRGVLLAGADFIKTSTGKISMGASPDAVIVMLLTVKEMSLSLNRMIGVKISGGIRTIEQAAHYMELANQIMGPKWLSPKCFRIGASQLLDKIMEKFP